MRKFLIFALVICASVVARAQDHGVNVQIQPLIGNGQFCLDAKGDRDQDGIPVLVYQCHGSENQRWTISASADNKHAILGIGGYCLDVRGSFSSANGTPVQLYKCHFGDNQRFSFAPDGRIREVRTGKCLLATAAQDQAAVVLNNCKNTPQEVFVVRH